MIAEWTAEHPPTGGLLIHIDGRALDRHHVGRIVRRVAREAGLGNVHPHQLRHTLATQAINRGMRLESIATMLGHRSLRMTLTYARIANKTVADEYASASAKIDALYTATDPEQRLEQLWPADASFGNQPDQQAAGAWRVNRPEPKTLKHVQHPVSTLHQALMRCSSASDGADARLLRQPTAG